MNTLPRGQRFFSLLAIVLALALLWLGPAVGAEASEVEESWYRIEMAGAPAGFLHERVSRDGEEIITESTTRLEIRRAAASLDIEMAQRFVETPSHEPLRAWSRQSLGQTPVETSWEFASDEVRVVHHQEGRERRQTLPRPDGPWVTPERAAKLLRQHLASGAERFTIVSVDPLAGLEPVSTLWVLEEREVPFALPGGETILASRWRQSQDLVPGVETVVLVDDAGRMLESRTRMMGLEMTMRLSSPPGDAGSAEGDASAAPEILVRTFVRPPAPIPRPRELQSAVYELSVEGGELPELPSAGAQRVEPLGARRARIFVDTARDHAVPAASVSDPEAFLVASTWLAHDDPLLLELRDQALAGAEKAPPQERAERLRRFVYQYLEEKDLDTGLATATEVARRKSGDCTEHSVLLAALLRGTGIPSRIVAGVVYVERFAGASGVFGYHMWTQALVEGDWHDLDATFEAPFDAAHIAFATASFADHPPPARPLARLAALMGRVQIEARETAHREPIPASFLP